MEKWVYIDYENMANLTVLPRIEGRYFLFVGEVQEKIPKALVFAAQENVNPSLWSDVIGEGEAVKILLAKGFKI